MCLFSWVSFQKLFLLFKFFKKDITEQFTLFNTGNVEERLSPLCIGRCDRADYGFQGSIDNVSL